MENKRILSTRKIVLTALLAALTVVGSALRITLPLEIAGTTSFHLGNILCALSGILLGPWLGGLAAGLGSAIYDMTNPLYISECWLTFLTKGAYGLVAGLVIGKSAYSYRRAFAATMAGAVTYAALYLAKSYFYSGLLINGLTAEAAMVTVIGKLPATVFNAAVAIVFAPILAVAIQKGLAKNHLAVGYVKQDSSAAVTATPAAAIPAAASPAATEVTKAAEPAATEAPAAKPPVNEAPATEPPETEALAETVSD